jgi:CBS domain-containing membrane protein
VTVEDEQHQGIQGHLSDRFGVGGRAAYGSAGSAVTIALCGLAAYLAKQPMLFPSLGPSALLFFEKPTAPESRPYNAVIGHLIGIEAGVTAIVVFGLLDAPSVLEVGVTLARVGAAALSVAVVALVLPPLRASHPPAGATTLLVSLGLLDEPDQLAWILAGVVLLTAASWVLNRLAGEPVTFRPTDDRTTASLAPGPIRQDNEPPAGAR